jgi:predicted transcriptional regulator
MLITITDFNKDRIPMNDTIDRADFVGWAADIVSAFVQNNSVPASELPGLISSVHAAISNLGSAAGPVPATEPAKPAVSIKKSVTPDYIICLEDGKQFKSLKRHLKGLGMSPEQYREKWNLPLDYPMVAPNYAATRSALAKSIGLGNNRKKAK